VNLCAILVAQLGNCFDFKDNLIEQSKIGLVHLLQVSALVSQSQDIKLPKRNLLELKFNFQTLLIDSFQKPQPFFFVHFKTRSHDSVAFLFEDDLH
jgi:hypothetical protein